MQVIPLSRTDTLGDRKSKTLIAVYQPQLELVNVNPCRHPLAGTDTYVAR